MCEADCVVGPPPAHLRAQSNKEKGPIARPLDVRQCTCQPSHLAIELSRVGPPDLAEACCLATLSRKSQSLSVECEDTRRRLI